MGHSRRFESSKPKWPVRCRPGRTRITTDDEVEFLEAVERFKRVTGKRFPTCCDLLKVIRALGYRKVAKPEPIGGRDRGR